MHVEHAEKMRRATPLQGDTATSRIFALRLIFERSSSCNLVEDFRRRGAYATDERVFSKTGECMEMLDRRSFVIGLGAVLTTPGAALAKKEGFDLDPKYQPQRVAFNGRYAQGTIVVDPEKRFLYLVEGDGFATRYGVSVGRAGLELKGTAYVARKAKWPFWRPTSDMIRRSPAKYGRYANGMRGGPDNPLGARALYLYRGNRDTYYRIHGTNQPSSIGQAVSNGCVRMLNDHVEELYERVPVGTFVVIL